MSPAVHNLLARMQAELPPPTHLRADTRAREMFLADYERVLAPWPEEVLDAAWPVVLARLEFWIWPRPQQILDACKQIVGHVRPPSTLEQRRTRALGLADRYFRDYRRRSLLARRAAAEGWLEPLLHFVRESAWVQAQLLAEVTPLGWDASLARHLGKFHSSAEAFAAFRWTIAGAVDRGRIEVRVPPSLLREWKTRSQPAPHDSRSRRRA
jgi:hypothetical protein